MTAPEAGHRGADGGGGRERLLRGPPPASPGHREGKRIWASARYDTVFTRRSTESNACLPLIETREIIPIGPDRETSGAAPSSTAITGASERVSRKTRFFPPGKENSA